MPMLSNMVGDTYDLVCLLVHIEAQKGLANLGEILQVERINGVFIGPTDMGYLSKLVTPEVQKSVQGGLCKEKGVY
jgi:4-hydroxy-2-oxoheptanedioate aldolase